MCWCAFAIRRHFSPDPITDDQLLPAQGLLELLRSLDPHT
jgi:restriction system protein